MTPPQLCSATALVATTFPGPNTMWFISVGWESQNARTLKCPFPLGLSGMDQSCCGDYYTGRAQLGMLEIRLPFRCVSDDQRCAHLGNWSDVHQTWTVTLQTSFGIKNTANTRFWNHTIPLWTHLFEMCKPEMISTVLKGARKMQPYFCINL